MELTPSLVCTGRGANETPNCKKLKLFFTNTLNTYGIGHFCKLCDCDTLKEIMRKDVERLDIHTKVEDAGFNTITRNCFLRADLRTVEDVLNLYNEQDEKLFCRNFRCFGHANYQKLTEHLKENEFI